MKPASTALRSGILLLLLSTVAARGDCTVTNVGLRPLPDLGFGYYRTNFIGGLYPGGAANRPLAHEIAGIIIAQNEILPRNFQGNVDTNNGRIAIVSIGMSNTTQEWASKGNLNFTARANPDPSRNPQLAIVDGAQGGRDATQWTNGMTGAWTNVDNRLSAAGVNSNMVQVVWIKQALAQPHNYGAFPAHAVTLQNMLEQIVRVAKQRFPNLKIAYISSRTRAYRLGNALNPEPYAYEGGFSTKWLIERQLNGQLNYDPARGPVVAPWLSWGPYLWADGTTPRSDEFTWLCSDLEDDFTHPNTNGTAKVGAQLLAFFKTDPTATPWFLRRIVTNQPPLAGLGAYPTNGAGPLTVQYEANAMDPDGTVRDVQWTFGDGTFSTNLTGTKTFASPGDYMIRLTATDNQGNTAQSAQPVRVTTTLAQWKAAKFTPNELSNSAISGDGADPDGDGIRNELEYLMGLEPKFADAATSKPRAELAGGYFTFTFHRYRFAADRDLALEYSPALDYWVDPFDAFALSGYTNNGLTETLTYRARTSTAGQGFLRLTVR